jgi:hypothetical protein
LPFIELINLDEGHASAAESVLSKAHTRQVVCVIIFVHKAESGSYNLSGLRILKATLECVEKLGTDQTTKKPNPASLRSFTEDRMQISPTCMLSYTLTEQMSWK